MIIPELKDLDPVEQKIIRVLKENEPMSSKALFDKVAIAPCRDTFSVSLNRLKNLGFIHRNGAGLYGAGKGKPVVMPTTKAKVKATRSTADLPPAPVKVHAAKPPIRLTAEEVSELRSVSASGGSLPNLKDVEEAVQKLRKQVKAKQIRNLDLKLATLDRLALILDPTIRTVLRSIAKDLRVAG